MKILVITNFYPPHHIGGYEIGCQEAVCHLLAKGHHVKVLTSNYLSSSQNQGKEEINIYRWLALQTQLNQSFGTFTGLLLIELKNHFALEKLLATFQPDIAYVWNMAGISVSLIFKLQESKIQIIYFVFDTWLSQWRQDHWYRVMQLPTSGLKGTVRRLLIRLSVRESNVCHKDSSLQLNENVQFASEYLKQCSLKVGQRVSKSPIIPWGIELSQYPYKEIKHDLSQLLYVGQIIDHKGVHIAIEALGTLVSKYKCSSASLTIVGDCKNDEYASFLEEKVSSLGLENRVKFIGFVKRQSLVPIYLQHGILIFPSVWDEPFGITLLEAMATGLPIVGTGNGGSSEILKHKVNSLVFPKEDFDSCAEMIKQLLDDPNLAESIRSNARAHVEQRYQLDQTFEKIESSINKIFGI